MDPIVFLAIAAAIWILVYVLAQFIGFDKLNEKGFEARGSRQTHLSSFSSRQND
jgi:hypothetical protein